VEKGDDLVVTGEKTWITNGLKADWMCTVVNTSQTGGPYKNKSLVIIPLNLQGASNIDN